MSEELIEVAPEQSAVGCEDCPLLKGRGVEDGMAECAVFAALQEDLQPRSGFRVSTTLEAAALLLQLGEKEAYTTEDAMDSMRSLGSGGAKATMRTRVNTAFEAIGSILGDDTLVRDRVNKAYIYRLDLAELRRGCSILRGQVESPEREDSNQLEPEAEIAPDDLVDKMAIFVLEEDGRSIEERINELKVLAAQLAKQHRGIDLEQLVCTARKIPLSDRHINDYARDALASHKFTMLSVIARM